MSCLADRIHLLLATMEYCMQESGISFVMVDCHVKNNFSTILIKIKKKSPDSCEIQ